jgi:hypothetical protein
LYKVLTKLRGLSGLDHPETAVNLCIVAALLSFSEATEAVTMTNKKNTPSYPLVLELDAKLYEISKTYSEYLPLEIGVYDVIVGLNLGYSNRVTKECIARHCGKEEYLFNTLSSKTRYKFMTGEPTGEITEGAIVYSLDMLKRIEKNRIRRGK